MICATIIDSSIDFFESEETVCRVSTGTMQSSKKRTDSNALSKASVSKRPREHQEKPSQQLQRPSDQGDRTASPNSQKDGDEHVSKQDAIEVDTDHDDDPEQEHDFQEELAWIKFDSQRQHVRNAADARRRGWVTARTTGRCCQCDRPGQFYFDQCEICRHHRCGLCL